MAIDNVFSGGRVADPREKRKDTLAVRALNEKIREDKRVEVSMLSIDDGLTLARRRR
jgi:O-methyltransferase